MGEMNRSILLLFLLPLSMCGGDATSAPPYWKMMLPNTPLPSAIRDLLQPGVGIHSEIMASGVSVGSNLHDKEKYELLNKYLHGRIPDEAIFFLEDDILPTRKLLMDFTRIFPNVALLSRSEASKFPFSSKKLPALLSLFSFHPDSVAAKGLKSTLDVCEQIDPIEKLKFCATSLESMVDFVTSNLGTHHVWALSTNVHIGVAIKQKYVVASSPKVIVENGISCHPSPYPYAVFYCHVTSDTMGYVVPLIGEDGTKVDAVAVCHTDTSSWEPTNVAFRMLNVKPGKIPICHFLQQGGVLWAPRAKNEDIAFKPSTSTGLK